MYSCGPLHMDEQKQYDQLEPTHSHYVPLQDVALKTSRKKWMIGRGAERGSGISVLMARRDDDDTPWSMELIFVLHLMLFVCVSCTQSAGIWGPRGWRTKILHMYVEEDYKFLKMTTLEKLNNIFLNIYLVSECIIFIFSISLLPMTLFGFVGATHVGCLGQE